MFTLQSIGKFLYVSFPFTSDLLRFFSTDLDMVVYRQTLNCSVFVHIHLGRYFCISTKVVYLRISEITIKWCSSLFSSWIFQDNNIILCSLPSLIINYQIDLLLLLWIYCHILVLGAPVLNLPFSSIHNFFYHFIQYYPLGCSLNSSHVGRSLWLLLLFLVLV